MATKKKKSSLIGGVRVPLKAPRKSATKKKPRKKTATKRAPLARAQTAKERADRAIAEIVTRLESIDTEHWEIGRALVQLDDPAIWGLYNETNYRRFLEEYVMPFSTARRLITVAKTYTKTIAQKIGLERGWQLERLARIDPNVKKSAEQLWVSNARLGKKRTPVRKMTAAEIAALVQGALLRSAKTKAKPTQEMKAAVKRYKAAQPYDVDVDLDLKKGRVNVSIDLEDWLAAT